MGPIDPTLRAPDGIAVCARCENEFVFWLPQRWPPEREPDVFHKIQQAIGKPVCPSCISDARAKPPGD